MANKIFSIDFSKMVAYDFGNLKSKNKGSNNHNIIPNGILCDCVCDAVWAPEPAMAVVKAQNLKSQVISRCVHTHIKG